MKKKIVLRIVLIIIGVLVILSAAGIIHCNSYYGCNCGSNIENEEGLLFTLNGSKTEYAVTGCVENQIKINPDVVIDSAYEGLPVTSVGNISFYRNQDLTSVVIPDSVTRIGWYAFYECTRLESITMANTITRIGWDAFRYCDSLSDIYYSGTIEEWNKISKGYQWNLGTTATVHCIDGDIEM